MKIFKFVLFIALFCGALIFSICSSYSYEEEDIFGQHLSGVITSVDEVAMLISVQYRSEALKKEIKEKILVTDLTEITHNGTDDNKVSDLKVGDSVTVEYAVDLEGEKVATAILIDKDKK